MGNILQLVQVTKSYQSTPNIKVLDRVSLSVNSGKLIAITGPSGTGKSTLLNICGLLETADTGEIILMDQSTTKLSDNKKTKLRQGNLGFIYQFHHLLPEFSALENLLIPQLIDSYNKSSAKQKASEILKQVGLSGKEDRLPNQLSGGELQRVAIARALICSPKLVLADEPTGNLDHRNSLIAFDLLKKMAQDHGTAIIMVTHNLELAGKCDEIYKLDNGILEAANG